MCKQNNWVLTDDDCAQYLRYLDPIAGSTGKQFELWQVCELPDGYAVAHDTVNIDEYDEEDINSTLASFGYDNLDEFVQENSPEPIPQKADGSLDETSPHYIVEWQLIAEMLFEEKALQCLLPQTWPDYTAAENFIKQAIGLDNAGEG